MSIEQAAWAAAWWAFAVILWCIAIACVGLLISFSVMVFGNDDKSDDGKKKVLEFTKSREAPQ